MYRAIAGLLLLSVGACAGIDPEAAKSLGAAGQGAAQALYTQANNAQTTLGELPALTVVREDLLCTAVKNQSTGQTGGKGLSDCLNSVIDPATKLPALNAAEAKSALDLAAIIQKRAAAASELQSAYTAYVALATYDAGQEASTAMTRAFSSINSLSAAISSVYPAASVASVITPELTKAVSAGIGFLAYERQRQLLLHASQDLAVATNALLADLNAEAEYATGIFQVLAVEKATVYGAFIQAGLVSAPQVLQPALNDVVQGATVAPNPPAAYQPAIASAAQHYTMVQTQSEVGSISPIYQAAIKTLAAVVEQQKQLAADKPIEVQEIWTQLQELKTLMQNSKS